MSFQVFTEDGVKDFSDASSEEQFGIAILMSLSSLMSFVLGGGMDEASWKINVGLLQTFCDRKEVVLRPSLTLPGVGFGPAWFRKAVGIIVRSKPSLVDISVDGVACRKELVELLTPDGHRFIARGVLAYRNGRELAEQFPLPAELTFAGSLDEWKALL
ncbi:MAG: hypothetical protein KDD69_14380 [Bdellovibrionales bacterium]|nr:hypothetical protein [Bdellovibrionales bacterium]